MVSLRLCSFDAFDLFLVLYLCACLASKNWCFRGLSFLLTNRSAGLSFVCLFCRRRRYHVFCSPALQGF